jgi:hypothetical protein
MLAWATSDVFFSLFEQSYDGADHGRCWVPLNTETYGLLSTERFCESRYSLMVSVDKKGEVGNMAASVGVVDVHCRSPCLVQFLLRRLVMEVG